MNRFVSTADDVDIHPPPKKTVPVEETAPAAAEDETPIPDEVLAEMEEEVDGWAREWGAVLVKALRRAKDGRHREAGISAVELLRLARRPVRAVFAEAARTTQAEFVPEEHPRQPEGSEIGGEFAGKGGGAAAGVGGGKPEVPDADVGDRLAQAEKNWPVYRGSGTSADDPEGDFGAAQSITDDNIESKIGKDAAAKVNEYILRDVSPTGDVAAALNKAVEVSPPLRKDLTSWRGMVMDPETIKNFKPGGTIAFDNPASFVHTQQVAYNFAKKGGARGGKGGDAVVIRALIPQGTKVARLNIAYAAGWEHVVHGGSSLKITSIRRLKRSTIVEGVIQ